MRIRLLAGLTLAPLLGTDLVAQVPLRELPELARQRAERLRPQQIAKLEPFWQDLSLDYRNNQQWLDQRIEKAAKLGDSVVPLLLEKLQPAQGGATARDLAANCRRVLEHLDPSSFVDALAELARGEHPIARTEAILLLGHANVPQAARVLTDLLGKTIGEDRLLVLRSLRMLRVRTAAPQAVVLLASADRRVREEVLTYLVAAKAEAVADTVVQALAAETDNRLLPFYIDYFAACTHRHEGATAALLPLLNRERIDWRDTRNLVVALAQVAPMGDEATCRKLHEMVDGNDTSSLAVQAAISLRRLGDKQGAVRLKRALDDKIRRRKREAPLYEQRASLLFATEDFSDAISDYQKILDFTEGIAMTRRAYLGLIRCEAHRRKIQNLVKYMKASGMTVAEFEELGREDEAVQKSLEHQRVRDFLTQLAKAQAPK